MGSHPAARTPAARQIPAGDFVTLDGELHYRIAAYHRMDPFLVSVPSDTDLWMFISTGGGLTAGRVDAEGSLFPYRTVDELHEAHHHTGPVTLIRADGEPTAWAPFGAEAVECPDTERTLYKSVTGNRLVFEARNHRLGLAIRYAWAPCDAFGWVRTVHLENLTDRPRALAVLDGLRNVLPFGAPLSLYQQAGNLVNAYKKSEVDAASLVGIFALTAGITDRAEALEVLRANTVWCCGLPGGRVHLSERAVAAFHHRRPLPEASTLNGARGSYLVSADLTLAPHADTTWRIIADAGRDQRQIAALCQRVVSEPTLDAEIERGLAEGTANLRRFVASADGLQHSSRLESSTHHFANVLFNTMRGGVFAQNYDLPPADFVGFLRVRQPAVAERHHALLADLPDPVTLPQLRAIAQQTGDPDLARLCHEYLPLHFGRRHGDPSRPWNRFAIKVRDAHGQRVLNYQGNWRDIFQNWEALATAFPESLPHIVAKFVNASTVDGFNPYRVNREGVEWEEIIPDDPWSNIGYWGDHQIIYLLKLLETWAQHDPAAIGDMLTTEIFSYADVPYRLRPYPEMLRDPSETITFDAALAKRIEARVERDGTDGKLLRASDGGVLHVNLLEKLLVPALSKLSSLVPDGGIWMNTQRPEWNDANNALADGGVSVVTLGHLRRYLTFLAGVLDGHRGQRVSLSADVADWLEAVTTTLQSERALLTGERLTPTDRRRVLDRLGEAFGAYREGVYARGLAGRRDLPMDAALDLCAVATAFVDWGLRANRRPDGLYHTYNLLDVTSGAQTAGLARLPIMLEGQVSILSSGTLAPDAALAVIDRLFASDLYRPSERSVLLYPERTLPSFMAKNAVPEASVERVEVLRALLAAGDATLIDRDAAGTCRFHPDLGNADALAEAMDALIARGGRWATAVARDRAAVLDLYEQVFEHRAYTGRSGTMYGYEGLGCIYWHMVAKLLLAVQEIHQQAQQAGAPEALQRQLAEAYFRVRAGIGYEKTVLEYGAFPTDPYSHTPGSGGARQPGMTGQVKEEILTRRGELGLHVEAGAVHFEPRLLCQDEFSPEPSTFTCFDVAGAPQAVPLPAHSLAFTLCQVPVIYTLGDAPSVRVTRADGTTAEHAGGALPTAVSRALFARGGAIARIEVTLDRQRLR